MIKDQAIRDRVLDISQSFLVQAPAGSGKTAILVQRFLIALAHVQTAPEEIVAITFTRKAAAEMRERILNALQAATEPTAPQDSYARALWQLAQLVLERDRREGWQLLNNPARLKIQTIDALCAGITKQMPILSRFGAQPQIEKDPQLLYARAVDQLLYAFEHDQNYPGHNALFILLEHLDNDRVKVKDLLMQMLLNRAHWLPTIAQHMHVQNLRQYLEKSLVLVCEEAMAELDGLVPAALDVAVMSHTEPQTLSEWLEIIDKLLTVEGTWRKQVTVAQGFHPPSRASNKDEKQRLQASKDAMHAMLEQLQPYEEFRQQLLVLRALPPVSYTDQQWHVVASLMEILPILSAQLTLVFRDQGQVDFNAVSLAALSALQDQDAPTDLSLALDCKLRHILVDEFQDTSQIQFRLLEQLTASWDGNDGRTLFLVGDPMQSIYRFRQAEVGLFLKAKEQGIGNIALEFAQLNVNFRSTANIMQWINQVFTSSFPVVDNKTLGAITYMSAQAADTTQQDYAAVQCIAVPDVVEPTEIVNIIQQCMTENPAQTIAILVRAKSHLFRILPALRAANIAYQGVDIEFLSKRPLIQDLLSLTNAILHLDDRIAWLALLRAPWCGLSLADLQILSTHETTIYAAILDANILSSLSAPAQIRVRRLAQIMHDQLCLRGRQRLSLIVRDAYTKLGGTDCMRLATENDEITAYLSFIESIEHKAEIYNPGYLAQQLENLFLEPAQQSVNAVQVMTMHKAKGLEFDVVILPGLGKKPRYQEQQLLLLEQRDFVHEFLLVAPIRAATQKEDTIYKYMAWCERQREEHETLRQLYVAVTRAKRKLYCLAEIDSGADVTGMLRKIWPQVATQFVRSTQDEIILNNRDKTLRRLPVPWFVQNPYAADALHFVARDLRLWHENWMQHAGTVLHRILWHVATIGVENLPGDFFEHLPNNCQQRLRMFNLTDAERDKAVELICAATRNMINDQFGARILSAQHKESHAEWAITKFIPEDPVRKFQQIRFDRVFLDDANQLWLIDYKFVTDANNIPDTVAKNMAQMQEYIACLKQLRPDEKISAGFYFPLQSHFFMIYCDEDVYKHALVTEHTG